MSDRPWWRCPRTLLVAVALATLSVHGCSSQDPSLERDEVGGGPAASDGGGGGGGAVAVDGAFLIRATADVEGVPAGSLVGEIDFVDGGSGCVVQGHLGGLGTGEAACAAGLATTEFTLQFPRAVLIAPDCDEPTWRVEIVLLELRSADDALDRFTGEMSFVTDLLRACDGLVDDPSSLRAPATFSDDPIPVEVVRAPEGDG